MRFVATSSPELAHTLVCGGTLSHFARTQNAFARAEQLTSVHLVADRSCCGWGTAREAIVIAEGQNTVTLLEHGGIADGNWEQ